MSQILNRDPYCDVTRLLLLGMDAKTPSLSAQKAVEALPRGVDGLPLQKAVIQSDNGSGYIPREYLQVLKEHGLGHHRNAGRS